MVIYGDEDASKYLREKYGVAHAPATLRKKRVTGGGPEFLAFNGRFCGYPEDKLDSWALERSEVVASTSEVSHGKPGNVQAGHKPDRSTPVVEQTRGQLEHLSE